MTKEELKKAVEEQQLKDRQGFATELKKLKEKYGCDLLPVCFLDSEKSAPVQAVLNFKIDIQVVNV